MDRQPALAGLEQPQDHEEHDGGCDGRRGALRPGLPLPRQGGGDRHRTKSHHGVDEVERFGGSSATDEEPEAACGCDGDGDQDQLLEAPAEGPARGRAERSPRALDAGRCDQDDGHDGEPEVQLRADPAPSSIEAALL
jgi:hypothetical protein